MFETKKTFVEPACNVETFAVEDVLTTSTGSGDFWGGGEF